MYGIAKWSFYLPMAAIAALVLGVFVDSRCQWIARQGTTSLLMQRPPMVLYAAPVNALLGAVCAVLSLWVAHLSWPATIALMGADIVSTALLFVSVLYIIASLRYWHAFHEQDSTSMDH